VHAFTATLADRPDQPLITFYDDATGERTELSTATLGNWVAKTANLLIDGLALTPGAVAAVRLPPHWQTAAVLLGCWAAGLTVDLMGDGPAEVAFVAGDLASRPAANPLADEVYALALDPLGMPFRPAPPPGTQDFSIEIRQYGDGLPSIATAPGQLALAGGPRQVDLVAAAPGSPAGRILIDVDAFPDPVTWLVAPLVAGASVVLCRHLDPVRVESRLATERAVRYP
jgi:uncharacterized protein (TIGR03089 family)